MSLNASLNAAMTGIRANSRGAEVTATNIANAMTEGYGMRALDLAARQGGGVRVVGETRVSNAVLQGDLRMAQARLGRAAPESEMLQGLANSLGLAGEDGALATGIARFEARLIEAASRPASAARLAAVHHAASDLTEALNVAARQVQTARARADADLARGVARLNDMLEQVAELNDRIQRHAATGVPVNALIDQRQALVDTASDLVPLREVERPGNQIALLTEGGAVLLDGRPARLAFTPTATITPDMSVAQGQLGLISLDGKPIGAGAGGQLRGGALEAGLALRDSVAPRAQAGLDALARNLIARFEAADASGPAPSGMGIFTDAGNPLNPAAETGLAGRISVHLAIDPTSGGDSWRLRDGLGATEPGPAGDPGVLQGLVEALRQPVVPASGGFLGGAIAFEDLAAEFRSRVGTEALAAQSRLATTQAQVETLRELSLREGVDTDAELQQLLLLERGFSANAQVLRAVDEMIQTLLSL